MPLPDERPRQSVANLIGRFEQQTKRQSLPATAPSRTASVVSHHTGDSAKAEIKEKREWPPRPKESPPGIAQTMLEDDTGPQPSPPPVPTSSEDEIPPIPTTEDTVTEPIEPTPVRPVETPVPVVKPAEPQVVAPKAVYARPPITPSKIASSKSHPGRTPVAAAAKTPSRTPVKSPPSSYTSLPTSRSTPSTQAKSATNSSVSASRSRPSSRTSQRPLIPSTPSRSKTPSAVRPKTPSTVRPKTPAASVPRPKTPASGLFAPTAASLAKARNVPEHVPTPTKKHSLGSDAANRLSQPTAASISKARPTPAVTSPPRATRTPARGVPPTRGTTVKPRGGAPSIKSKEIAKSAGSIGKKAGAAMAVVAATEEPAVEGDHAHSEHSTLGADDSAHTLVDEDEHNAVGLTPEHKVRELEYGKIDDDGLEVAFVAEPESHEAGVPAEIRPETESNAEEVDAHLDLTEAEPAHEVESQVEDIPVEIHEKAVAVDDLADAVGMLEFVPRTRPTSSTAVPDEVADIPDE